MNKLIKPVLLVVIGLFIGAGATFVTLGQMNVLDYRDYFLMAAREQIFIASALRSNQEGQVQEQVEANLPNIVLAIDNDVRLRKSAGAHQVLQQIRDFYEKNSLPVPPEISATLNAVPRDR